MWTKWFSQKSPWNHFNNKTVVPNAIFYSCDFDIYEFLTDNQVTLHTLPRSDLQKLPKIISRKLAMQEKIASIKIQLGFIRGGAYCLVQGNIKNLLHLGTTTRVNWRIEPERSTEPYPTKTESRNRHCRVLLTTFLLHLLFVCFSL